MNWTALQQRWEARLEGWRAELASRDWYRRFRSWPLSGQIAAGVGAFALSQVVVFGLLYLIFGATVVVGFFASFLAGLATVLGALPAVLLRRISFRAVNFMMGMAAGIMLSATAYSLVEPGVEYGDVLWPGKGVYIVIVGMLVGAWFLDWAERTVPHEMFAEDRETGAALRRVWLFVAAITLHNFPEGLSVGVSFGSGDWNNGTLLAIAIGAQNIPEGLAVALPLVTIGYKPWKAVAIAMISGLVEPVGGLLGVTLVTVFHTLLPLAMGFAAGAMLYVIAYEIIPEMQSKERSSIATYGVLIGFAVMTILESTLG